MGQHPRIVGQHNQNIQIISHLQLFPFPAIIPAEENLISTSNILIEANTIESSLEEMCSKQLY
jgi:hypothetical protein